LSTATPRGSLRAQLIRKIAITEYDDPQGRMTVREIGNSFQQIAMPLARYQLTRGCDRKVTLLDAKFRSAGLAIRLDRKCLRINGAANHRDPLVFHAVFAKNRSDRFRNRDDFSERLVPQSSQQSHFGVIDPAGNYRGNIGIGRSQPTEQIGSAATVAMDDIRPLFFEELREPIGEWQIEITGAKQVLNLNPCHARKAVDSGIGRANKNIVVPTLA
jgi:hypothetical protein